MVHDNSTPHEAPASGAEFIRQWLPTLLFVDQLRIRLVAIQPDVATLTLPFAASPATLGAVVHAGAIASLIESVAMVAVWSDTEPRTKRRGMTWGLTIK